jgi:lipopolysaccharide export system protein LptC
MSSPTDSPASRALRWAGVSRFLSWVAMALGLAFVVMFLVQAGLFASLMPDEPAAPPVVNPDQITATDSTVNGMDKENQPYEVTAKRGWQDDTTLTLVHLEDVEGKFRRAAGAEYTLSARTGTYDTKVKELDLEGDVTIVQKDRFTAVMDKAHVVVEEKKLTTAVPVDVTFGTGTIKANGMEITDDGARILFLNGVKARFDGAAAKGDQNP